MTSVNKVVREILSFLPAELSHLVLLFRGTILFDFHQATPFAVQFSPSGRYLALYYHNPVEAERRPIHQECLVEIYDLRSFQLIFTYRTDRFMVDWNPNEEWLAIANHFSVELFEMDGPGHFYLVTADIYRFVWIEQGLIITNGDGELSLWNPWTQEKQWARSKAIERAGGFLVWDPKTRAVVVGEEQTPISWFRLGESTPFRILPCYRLQCRPKQNSDGLWTWVTQSQEDLFLQVVHPAPPMRTWFFHVAKEREGEFPSSWWSPNEREVFASIGERVLAWDYQTGQIRTVFQTDGETIHYLSMCGDYLAVVIQGKTWLVEVD